MKLITIKNSWHFLRDSWTFFKKNLDLAILPVISLIAVSFVALLLLFSCNIGASTLEVFHACNPESIAKSAYLFVLLKLFVVYIVSSFITTFCNAALMVAVIYRLQGKSCRIYQALQLVSYRWRVIFGWSFISATISVLLRIFESPHRSLKSISAALLGGAWSLTQFFVLPILVFEGMGVVESIRKSAKIFGKYPKRVFALTFVLSLIFMVCVLGSFMLIKILPILSVDQMKLEYVVSVIVILLMVTFKNIFNSLIQSAVYLKACHNTETQIFSKYRFNEEED